MMSLEPTQLPPEISIELENRAKHSLSTQLTQIFNGGRVLLIDGTQFTLDDFGYFSSNPVQAILLNQYIKDLRAKNQPEYADSIKAGINPDSRLSMLKAFVVMPHAIEQISFVRVDYAEFRPRKQQPLHGVTLGRKQWSRARDQISVLPLVVETPNNDNNLFSTIASVANKRVNKNRTFMQHWTVNFLETNFPELKNTRQMNRIGREVFLDLAQHQLGDLTELFNNGQLHGQFLFNF